MAEVASAVSLEDLHRADLLLRRMYTADALKS
jgi:hypothetical protein